MSDTRIIVYIYGCSCGKNATHITKVRKYADENDLLYEFHNSKYSEANRTDHRRYLTENNMKLDDYTAIVVNGDEVTPLHEWN